jgi:hypothetical protein
VNRSTRLGFLVGLVLIAGCATDRMPERVLDVVKSCGTVLYAGYLGVLPTSLSVPTERDRATAPAAGTALPPAPTSPSTNIAIFRFTSDCAHGDQVVVTPGAYAQTVARSEDGGISGLTLDVVGPVTIYDFRHGQLVGVAHLPTGR